MLMTDLSSNLVDQDGVKMLEGLILTDVFIQISCVYCVKRSNVLID